MSLRKNIEALAKIHGDDVNTLLPTALLMIVSYCDIDQSRYHIISSYAIRQIKPVSDLDIVMHEDEWKKLAKCGLGQSEIYNNQDRYFINIGLIDIEIFSKKDELGYPNADFSMNSLRPNLVSDAYGHLHYSFEMLVSWKVVVHRNKDREHLTQLMNDVMTLKQTAAGNAVIKAMHIADAEVAIANLNEILAKW